jgi:hypothetical protein
MKYIVLALLLVLFPRIAQAQVRITEVAWMGTADSQYSEWIELYNESSNDINVSGWKLYEGDGGPLVFTFTKSISANGYLLLERTTASAPDAVPGVSDESGSFGAGGFANTGEDLVLKDSSGSIVDELNFLDGWPAGDATTKQTMQWNGQKWITASATPKEGVHASQSDSDTEDEVIEDTGDPFPIPAVSPNKPMISFTVPSVVYTGIPYEFFAQPILEYNFRIHTGNIYWNMGDGTVVRQQNVAPIFHTYTHAGTYTVYYSYTDARTQNTALTGMKKIKVVEPELTIAMIGTNAIGINNTSNTPVDLSGWKVFSGGRYVLVPDKTIVAEKIKGNYSVESPGYCICFFCEHT